MHPQAYCALCLLLPALAACSCTRAPDMGQGATPSPKAEAPPAPKASDGTGLQIADHLDLNYTRWGAAVPNSLKAMSIAYDPVEDRVFTSGMSSGVLVSSRTDAGHPDMGVELDARDRQISEMHTDPERRRLFWLSRSGGHLRVVDLDSHKVVASVEPDLGTRAGPKGRKRFYQATMDPTTGWLWVVDPNQQRITGYNSDLSSSKVLSDLENPLRAYADPSGDDLYVMDLVDQSELQFKVVRTSTGETRQLKTFPWPAAERAKAEGARPARGERPAPGARPARGERPAPGARPPRGERPEPGARAARGERPARAKAPLGEGASREDRVRPKVGGTEIPRPTGFHVTETGTIVFLTPRIVIGTDKELKIKWILPVDGEIEAVASTGEHLLLAIPDGQRAQGKPESQVVVVNASSGSKLATMDVGFEANRMAVDPKGSRVFVSNGGDGSVSVIDLDRLSVQGSLDVANSAERVRVDSKTGDRYILDRLGGSEIHVWKADGDLVTWSAGRWPVDMALDSNRRRLVALSHYDSAFHVWDIDGPDTLPTISLGIPGNTGDTISDMAYDPATGYAAAVLPEHGKVALADIVNREVLWAVDVEGLRTGPDDGPGRGFVEIDHGRNRVLVAIPQADAMAILDLETGKVQRMASLPEGADAKLVLRIDALYVDPVKDRIFLGPMVLDRDALTLSTIMSGVHQVVHVDEQRLIGLALDDDAEFLVDADPDSLKVRRKWRLGARRMMAREVTFDPAKGIAWVSSMPAATVTGYVLPSPTASAER